jgi:acyl carrier protein
MMTEEKIIQTTNDFLGEEFEVKPDRLIPSANLKETLELDSLDYIDLVVAMEKHLGIKVDPADLSDIHTLKDLYDYLVLKIRKDLVQG